MQVHSFCLILSLTVPPATPTVRPTAQATAQRPATQQEKPQTAKPKINPEDLPVSLDRIQAALAKTPMLRFDQDDRPVFRVQVFGDKPTIEHILGPTTRRVRRDTVRWLTRSFSRW